MGFVILSIVFNFLSIIFVSEVRPAPHMDNLVGIYKSMEDASGINIFMTQNAPSTKSSGIFLHMHFTCDSFKISWCMLE